MPVVLLIYWCLANHSITLLLKTSNYYLWWICVSSRFGVWFSFELSQVIAVRLVVAGLQTTEASNGLLIHMSGSWCFLSSRSSTGFVRKSCYTWPIHMTWAPHHLTVELWEETHSKCSKRPSQWMLKGFLRPWLGSHTVFLLPRFVSQSNSQDQTTFKIGWNRLYLPMWVLQSILVRFN